jgi:PadR family transcriptional regulator AphA
LESSEAYSLTERGREALRAWTETPTESVLELRDPGLLKLFFGADPGKLAGEQLVTHRRRLEDYTSLRAQATGNGPPGPLLALEASIGHEQEYVRFWSKIAEDGKGNR